MNTVSNWLTLPVLLTLSACSPSAPAPFQGYVEADFRYLASTGSGVLTELAVQRGQRVSQGQVLFAIDAVQEQQEILRIDAQLQQQQAQLDNLLRGQRPQELAVLRAQLQQARAQAQQSQLNWQRVSRLRAQDQASPDQFDAAQASKARDDARVNELQARIGVAELGARAPEISAARAQLKATQAQREQAQWRLQQKQVTAPGNGLIQDVLYHPGEVVAAARPVIVLLPDDATKLRFYVSASVVGDLQRGRRVRARCDGCRQPIDAEIRYISRQTEYTPPVLFNRDNRSELMFRVEAYPAPGTVLAIGQPLDVWLQP
jgi:HlyD family secretion protein